MHAKVISASLAGCLMVPALAPDNPVRIDSGLIAGEIGPVSVFKGIEKAVRPTESEGKAREAGQARTQKHEERRTLLNAG